MREKIQRFMQGRYGVDELSRFMTGLSLVILVLELLTRNAFFGILFWADFIWIYYRMFSRQYGKRQQENQKYLTLRYQFKTKWYQLTHKNGKAPKFSMDKLKREIAQRKDFHIYKCPNCSQKIRIPRGKGNIMVRCPKCYTEFQKRS